MADFSDDELLDGMNHVLTLFLNRGELAYRGVHQYSTCKAQEH